MLPASQDWSSNMAEQQRDNRRDPRRRPDMVPEEKQFDERVVHIDRVARVVKGGRRFRFRALVVVGDRKGKVGIGTAKGADVTTAVAKAVEVAKKNFVTITLYKGTLAHEAEAKVSGARILLMPAAPGTGLRCSGPGGCPERSRPWWRRRGSGSRTTRTAAAPRWSRAAPPAARPGRQTTP